MTEFENAKNNLKPNEEILAIAQYKKQKANIVLSIVCVALALFGILFVVVKIPYASFVWFGASGVVLLVDIIFALRILCSGCLRKNKFLIVTNQRIIGITNTRKSVLINCSYNKVQCAYLYADDNMRVIIDSKAYVFQILANANVLAKKIDEQLDMRDERQQKKEQQALMANNPMNGAAALGKEVLY